MRWIRYAAAGTIRLGIEDGTDGSIRDLTGLAGRVDLPEPCREAVVTADMVKWIAHESLWRPHLQTWLDRAEIVDREEVRVLAPIARPPKNIFCVGRNYRAHALEAARFRGQEEKVPDHPMIFTKPPTAI